MSAPPIFLVVPKGKVQRYVLQSLFEDDKKDDKNAASSSKGKPGKVKANKTANSQKNEIIFEKIAEEGDILLFKTKDVSSFFDRAFSVMKNMFAAQKEDEKIACLRIVSRANDQETVLQEFGLSEKRTPLIVTCFLDVNRAWETAAAVCAKHVRDERKPDKLGKIFYIMRDFIDARDVDGNRFVLKPGVFEEFLNRSTAFVPALCWRADQEDMIPVLERLGQEDVALRILGSDQRFFQSQAPGSKDDLSALRAFLHMFPQTCIAFAYVFRFLGQAKISEALCVASNSGVFSGVDTSLSVPALKQLRALCEDPRGNGTRNAYQVANTLLKILPNWITVAQFLVAIQTKKNRKDDGNPPFQNWSPPGNYTLDLACVDAAKGLTPVMDAFGEEGIFQFARICNWNRIMDMIPQASFECVLLFCAQKPFALSQHLCRGLVKKSRPCPEIARVLIGVKTPCPSNLDSTVAEWLESSTKEEKWSPQPSSADLIALAKVSKGQFLSETVSFLLKQFADSNTCNITERANLLLALKDRITAFDPTDMLLGGARMCGKKNWESLFKYPALQCDVLRYLCRSLNHANLSRFDFHGSHGGPPAMHWMIDFVVVDPKSPRKNNDIEKDYEVVCREFSYLGSLNEHVTCFDKLQGWDGESHLAVPQTVADLLCSSKDTGNGLRQHLLKYCQVTNPQVLELMEDRLVIQSVPGLLETYLPNNRLGLMFPEKQKQTFHATRDDKFPAACRIGKGSTATLNDKLVKLVKTLRDLATPSQLCKRAVCAACDASGDKTWQDALHHALVCAEEIVGKISDESITLEEWIHAVGAVDDESVEIEVQFLDALAPKEDLGMSLRLLQMPPNEWQKRMGQLRTFLSTLFPDANLHLPASSPKKDKNVPLRDIKENMKPLQDALSFSSETMLQVTWRHLDTIVATPALLQWVKSVSDRVLREKFDDLRSKCVQNRALLRPLREVERLVMLPAFRDLARHCPSPELALKKVAELLQHKDGLPVMDSELVERHVVQLQCAGAEDGLTRVLLMAEDLMDETTVLKLKVEERGGCFESVVILHAPRANVINTLMGAREVRDEVFERLRFELQVCVCTLQNVQNDENQSTKKIQYLMRDVQDFEKRITEVHERQKLLATLLSMGWYPPKADGDSLHEWTFRAIGSDQAPVDATLTTAWLKGQLRDQERFLIALRQRMPWISHLHPRMIREDSLDSIHFLRVIAEKRGLEERDDDEIPVHWQPFFEAALKHVQPAWVGQGVSSKPRIDDGLTLIVSEPAKLALTLGKICMRYGDMCPDEVFPCSGDTGALAVDGLLWRLEANGGHSAQLQVVVAPELLYPAFANSLCQKLIIRTKRNVNYPCRCIVLCADPTCTVALRLSRWRNLDVEAELHNLAPPALENSGLSVVTGPSLCGKSKMLKEAHTRRIIMHSDMSEAELVRLIRTVLRDSDVNNVVLDFGTPPPSVVTRFSATLWCLAAYHMAGLALPLPCCLDPPRAQGCKGDRKVVVEIRNISRISFLDTLEPTKPDNSTTALGDEKSDDTDTDLAALMDLAALPLDQMPPTDNAVLQAMKDTLTKTTKVVVQTHSVSTRTPLPYTHTRESLRVMAHVLHNVVNRQPVILIGETGCGKTYLLQKFVELYRDAGVEQVCPCLVSLSHAFTDYDIDHYAQQVVQRPHDALHFVILDEVNATMAQETCKHLLWDRICGQGGSGKSLPRNVLFAATCNPKHHSYVVDALHESLYPLAFKVAALTQEDMKEYLCAQLTPIVEACTHSGRDVVPLKDMATTIANAVMAAQDALKRQWSSFEPSLRDAARCTALMRALQPFVLVIMATTAKDHDRRDKGKRKEATRGDDIVDNGIVALLALYLCYGLQMLPREEFFSLPEVTQLVANPRVVIRDVQTRCVQQAEQPAWVIMTDALRDNLLAEICIAYVKDPAVHLLLLGDEACSKTLSLSLFTDWAQGEYAKDKVFSKLPRLQPFRTQLTKDSTPKMIFALAECAKLWMKTADTVPEDNSRALIVLEELGMASAETLKALHNLLDSYQIDPDLTRPFAFVATANYTKDNMAPIDRALQNRLLIVRHESMGTDALLNLCDNLSKKNAPKLLERLLNTFPHTQHTPTAHHSSNRTSHIFTRSKIAFARDLKHHVDPARLFWRHLQHLDPQVCAARWETFCRDVVPMDPNLQRPSLEELLEMCLDKDAKVVRHVLLPFGTPRDFARVMRALHNVQEKGGMSEQRATLFVKCDAYAPDASMLPFLMDIRAALEKGMICVVVNPFMLESLHAILNADIREGAASIAYRSLHEMVIVKPEARLVFVMDAQSCKKLHPAQLSRLSVLTVDEYEGQDDACVVVQCPKNPMATLEQVWKNGDFAIDHTFQDITEQLREGCTVCFTRVPPTQTECVIAQTCESLSEFKSKYTAAVKQNDKSKDGSVVIVSLFGLHIERVMDVLVVLGLAGKCGIKDDAGGGKTVQLHAKRQPQKLLVVSPWIFAPRFVLYTERPLYFHWVDELRTTEPELGSMHHLLRDSNYAFDKIARPIAEMGAVLVTKEALRTTHASTSCSEDSTREEYERFANRVLTGAMLKAFPKSQERLLVLDSPAELNHTNSLRVALIRYLRGCCRRALGLTLPLIRAMLTSEAMHHESARELFLNLMECPAIPTIAALRTPVPIGVIFTVDEKTLITGNKARTEERTEETTANGEQGETTRGAPRRRIFPLMEHVLACGRLDVLFPDCDFEDPDLRELLLDAVVDELKLHDSALVAALLRTCDSTPFALLVDDIRASRSWLYAASYIACPDASSVGSLLEKQPARPGSWILQRFTSTFYPNDGKDEDHRCKLMEKGKAIVGYALLHCVWDPNGLHVLRTLSFAPDSEQQRIVDLWDILESLSRAREVPLELRSPREALSVSRVGKMATLPRVADDLVRKVALQAFYLHDPTSVTNLLEHYWCGAEGLEWLITLGLNIEDVLHGVWGSCDNEHIVLAVAAAVIRRHYDVWEDVAFLEDEVEPCLAAIIGPLRNFLLRVVYCNAGEAGLRNLPANEWTMRYRGGNGGEIEEMLMAIDGFLEEYQRSDEDEWLHPLENALGLHDHSGDPALFEQWTLQLEYENIRVMSAVWFAALSSPAARTSPLGRNPRGMDNADRLYLPAQPDSRLAILRAQLTNQDSINRCQCGFLYIILNCGRPAAVGRCPDCHQEIGGRGHQHLPGNTLVHHNAPDEGSFGVANDVNDDPRHSVRGLNPLCYRLINVLILFPLALRADGAVNPERYRALCAHLRILRRLAHLGAQELDQVLGKILSMCYSDLFTMRLDFSSHATRLLAEQNIQTILEPFLEFDVLQRLAGDAQRSIEANSIERAVVQLRESYLDQLPPGEQDEMRYKSLPLNIDAHLSMTSLETLRSEWRRREQQGGKMDDSNRWPLTKLVVEKEDTLVELQRLRRELVVLLRFAAAIHEKACIRYDPGKLTFADMEAEDIEEFKRTWAGLEGTPVAFECQQLTLAAFETLTVRECMIIPGTQMTLATNFLLHAHNSALHISPTTATSAVAAVPTPMRAHGGAAHARCAVLYVTPATVPLVHDAVTFDGLVVAAQLLTVLITSPSTACFDDFERELTRMFAKVRPLSLDEWPTLPRMMAEQDGPARQAVAMHKVAQKSALPASARLDGALKDICTNDNAHRDFADWLQFVAVVYDSADYKPSLTLRQISKDMPRAGRLPDKMQKVLECDMRLEHVVALQKRLEKTDAAEMRFEARYQVPLTHDVEKRLRASLLAFHEQSNDGGDNLGELRTALLTILTHCPVGVDAPLRDWIFDVDDLNDTIPDSVLLSNMAAVWECVDAVST
eukprot:GEMP01000040.1.p1 GENE.GEMP01000040.1~~GEMP01000040.1.p1  ORF type:complete len:3817 (+),score=1018.01 GEMP01000040.1:35-11485(+)